MIDNVRLSGDQRFALVMEDFDLDNETVKLVAVCFPGTYSSQRDQPLLADVIHQLRDNRFGRNVGGS